MKKRMLSIDKHMLFCHGKNCDLLCFFSLASCYRRRVCPPPPSISLSLCRSRSLIAMEKTKKQNKNKINNLLLQITKGEKVTVAGFGTFERRERPERSGRNPRTGEALTIAARSAPAFVAAKALKEQVDGGEKK